MGELRQARLIKPTDIEGRLGTRYGTYPGPHAINYADLWNIFPGMKEEQGDQYDRNEYPAPKYGEMNLTERELLTRVVRWLQPKVMVEYGTLYGRGTQIMAENSPDDARILTVDLPQKVRDDPTREAPWSTDTAFMHLDEYEVGHHYKNSDAAHKVTQMRMDATTKRFEEKLGKWLNGDTIDLAIVDAAHDFYTTQTLFMRTLLQVSPGGVILNDDYGAGRSPTLVGVTEFFANRARQYGMRFFHFAPFPAPKDTGNPSALLYIDLPGAGGDKYRRDLATMLLQSP